MALCLGSEREAVSKRGCLGFLSCLVLASGIQAQGTDQRGSELLEAILRNDLASMRRQISAKADVNARGERDTTPLMYAAAHGSLDAMNLLIDAGADVNAKNGLDITPLIWAVSDPAKVRLLLEKGADANARSKQGRTSLIIASDNGSLEIARMLLAKDADPKASDGRKNTALFGAAVYGNIELVRLLLEKGLDVNAVNFQGSTPLMEAAANGRTEIVKLFLAKGANVNAVSGPPMGKVKNGVVQIGKFTPLLLAATYGPPELVKVLLDAGADPNSKDCRGMTPLMLAVTSERQNPEVVTMLLNKGADPKLKSDLGETAGDWAAKFGRPRLSSLLGREIPERAGVVIASAAATNSPPRQVKEAAERGVALLQRTSLAFFRSGGCAACHHQNATAIAVSIAREHGLRVDEAAAAEQLKTVKFGWSGQHDTLLQRLDAPGGVGMVAYALLGLAAEGYKPDLTTFAMAANVAAQQSPNGSFHVSGIARTPTADGDIVETALGIFCLAHFAPEGRRAEFETRIARAREWLLHAKPVFNEDRTMRLRGLRWADADPAAIRKAAEELRAEQRPDGGWAQNPHLASDAYATGKTLYALNQVAGLRPGDPAYRKGIAYLRKTQLEDGSWHVKSRAVKFQPYFQSGFPHDHDQWISSIATAWATTALASALDNSQQLAAGF